MKSLKQIGLLLLILVFTVVMAACGNGGGTQEGASSTAPSTNEDKQENAAQTRVLKIGHVTQEEHVFHSSIVKLKEEIEKRSGGAMRVDIFPAMQLGGEADMFEQVRNGALDMISSTVASVSTRSDAFHAWYMPYVLGGIEPTWKMIRTDVAKEILNSLDESEGVHPLGYIVVDNRNMFASKKPILTMEDIQGMSVRIPPGPATSSFYEAIGATPTPVEHQEVYQALQTGLLDAADVDTDAVMSNRYFELGGHLTLTNHQDWVMPTFFSKVIWDELTDEEKTIIEESMRAAEEFSYQATLDAHNDILKRVEEEGIEIHEFQEMDKLLEIANQIHEEYSAKHPLIEEFIKVGKEIGNY